MLRLAKVFWDIALWRRTPEQLPASVFLLCLVAAASALLEVIEALLPPPASSGEILTRVVLRLALPLAFAWLVLAAARQRPRFLQTGTALLGVAVIADFVICPLVLLSNSIGVDRPLALPVSVLSMAALIWYLLACANIWRAALNARLGLGAAISLGYLVLTLALDQQLLPNP